MKFITVLFSLYIRNTLRMFIVHNYGNKSSKCLNSIYIHVYKVSANGNVLSSSEPC